MARIKVAFIKDLMGQYSRDEISFSRMCEMINEEIASELQESGERKTAEKIVEENFKGLDSLIDDKDILDFYKRLIVNCILEYKPVPEISDKDVEKANPSDQDIWNAAKEYAEENGRAFYTEHFKAFKDGATECRDNNIYIAPKQNNEVTIYDLRVDDLAREERNLGPTGHGPDICHSDADPGL